MTSSGRAFCRAKPSKLGRFWLSTCSCSATGGSTLIKRLAVAYADPARREEIADDLPKRDWLPLFFRCRELRSLARGSFADLLEALSQSEPVRQHAVVFRAHVDRALLAGRVLLLVDGLDEISDQGDRAAFVCTLRAALQAYPGTAIVVTSREAGFRHVAAHLAPICTQAIVSPFDPEDIRRLSVVWHREVVGDTEKVRADAERLAATIADNDRILRLAMNPLLLTTLLLVKRWVGSLPTRRAALYGKAVEVLLMTWNTEGHAPIPEDEALPQLCYVASAMMIDGVQRISRPRLAALLQEARDSLPTELGYVQGTVDQFIHRVEDRSSLLMMTGHDVEDGRLVEFFEFRHLTFQEFLTAMAMVKGWHSGRMEEDTLVSALGPHLEKEQWREVIPLAAVLGGKETEALIRRLTEEVSRGDPQQMRPSYSAFLGLGNCLADEAAARPDTIRAAVRQLVHRGTALIQAPFAPTLLRGRYGTEFRVEAGQAFLSATTGLGNAGDALLAAVWWQTLETEDRAGYARATDQFVEMLRKPDVLRRCEGAAGVGYLCGYLRIEAHSADLATCAESLSRAGPIVTAMLDGTLAECCFAAYALRSLGACRIWEPPLELELLPRLFRVWRHATEDTVRRLAGEAFASQPLLPRDGMQRKHFASPIELDQLLAGYDERRASEQAAILVVSWYCPVLTDADIAKRARRFLTKFGELSFAGPTLRQLLGQLGKQP